ncbi:DNA glycosylase, partial [Pholiota conissans]
MPAARRVASTRRSPQLAARASEFSPQVTLFEVADPEESPRRSTRARKPMKTEVDDDDSIPDMEDYEYSPTSKAKSMPSPKKAKAKARTVTPRKREASAAASSESPPPTKRKPRSPTKAKAIPQTLSTPHPEPPKWREAYAVMKAQRSRFIAPVDTMGCQRAQVEETIPQNRRFATLVALMLSSQTRDQAMYAAVLKLREALGGSISVDAVIAADNSVILVAISSVGFLNKKAVYIKKAAVILRDKFDSDVPKTVDELCSLPGVGPKMAFLTLEIAWGITTGIGVDVHVHRITNLLGWHKPKTGKPEDTRLNLQSWLPKDLWRDINHMMVGFGQVICQPGGTRCDYCDLSTKGLCPGARKVDPKLKKEKPIIFIPAPESSAEVEIAFED